MGAVSTSGARRWLCLLAWGLIGCKTGGSEGPAPIFSEPGLQAPADEPGNRAAPVIVPLALPPAPPPPPTPLLAEQLKPVRGGARVLPPYLGPDPCKMALTGDSPVAKACSDGGERRAIDMMTLFVKRARAEGFNFKCGTCHVDEDDRSKLAPNADAEFRKLLFLARPED